MAPAPSARRRGPAGRPPRPRPGSSVSPRSNTPRWVWVVVAGVILLAAYLLWTRKASAGSLNTGTPGPDLTGQSAAQQPSGGAASIPGNLPPVLLGRSPDDVQQQVQQADTSSVEAPQALAAATVTSDAVETAPTAVATPTPTFGYGINAVTPGIDPAQAFAAAVYGVAPRPNMTLDQLNAELREQGLATQSYPTTIHANTPAQISSTTMTPSPAISDIQRHFVYGRDPEA